MFSFLLPKSASLSSSIETVSDSLSVIEKSVPRTCAAGEESSMLLSNKKKQKPGIIRKSFLYGKRSSAANKNIGKPNDRIEKLAKTFRLDKKAVKNYYEAFILFDKNKDGSITTAEIRTVMLSLGISVTDAELEMLIARVDENDNGSIEFEEFVRLMSQHKSGHTEADDIKHAFNIFDKDKDGYISSYELSAVMDSLGEKMDEQEICSLIREADKDGDGRVNFEEFHAMVRESWDS